MSSNQDFYSANRHNLMNLVPDNSAVLVFAAKPQIRSWDSYFPYCQNKNFYYLTGYEHRSAALLMKKVNNNVSVMLFVVQLTPVQIHWNGYLPSPKEAEDITGIKSVDSMGSFYQHLFTALKQVESIYLDFQPVALNEPIDNTLQFADMIRKTSPHITVKRIHSLMGQLRQIKKEEEIECISKAIKLTHKGLDRMVHFITPGIFEYELEAHYNFELHINRTVPAFQTIVATGKNSTILHYSSLNSRLHQNDMVLLDLGAEYQHYSADVSRTLPANGQFSEKQLALYNLVLKANLETIQAVQPGMSLSSLNDVTKKILAQGLKTMGYIENPDDVSKYYTHGVTHSLGLDAHDIVSDTLKTLQPGMIITIEPGLYIPEDSIGIRIEDDILVTQSGAVNLSEDIPKKPEDIVEWMSR